MPVVSRAPHWQPVRMTKKMASMALRSGTLRLWPPSGWDGRGGRSEAIRSYKRSGTRHRSSWTGVADGIGVARAAAMIGPPGAVTSSKRAYGYGLLG
jgi:hypothetical protein